jgi:hypothetical protein
LVGTSTFDHADQLPSLAAVRNNLTDLRAVLTDPVTGIFTDEHCLVVAEPRTQTDVVRPLSRLARQAADLLLVYYSGHGVQHPIKDELYLAVGSTDREVLSVSAVAFEHIREAIGDSPARTKLLILDCCYSGMAVGAMSTTTLSPNEVRVEGTAVIASSPRNRISYAPPGDRYTAFSAELIRLLRDGPSIGGLPLTVQALFNGLKSAMANRDMPTPQLNSGNTSGELLLRKAPPPRIEVRLPRYSMPTPKPVRASTTPLGPIVPFDRLSSGSLVDQPTVPAWPPVRFEPAAPEVLGPPVGMAGQAGPVARPPFSPAALVAPVPPSAFPPPPIARPKVSRVGLFLLWVAFLFCADFAVAGFVGFTFGRLPDGTRSGADLGSGIAFLVFAAGLGVILRWRILRKRALSGTTVSRPPRMPLGFAVALLIVICLFCLGLSIAVVATWDQVSGPAGQSSAGTPSTTLSETTLLLWLVEGVLASALAVFRRFTTVRPDQHLG